MRVRKVLVTGSGGLIGYEASSYFAQFAEVVGFDLDKRSQWFGDEASVLPNIEKLMKLDNYTHWQSSNQTVDIVKAIKPDAIIHCAGQPSHEWSILYPTNDFSANAAMTLYLLEAARLHCPEAPFIFTSTNKVYGDRPNQLELIERDKRYDFENMKGVDESMSIDHCLHTPFGVSKTFADLMVQEYHRCYGMPTVSFRCGCITGSAQKGVQRHGFLNYLCKCGKNQKDYTIFGYGGKQVRDNLHASDLVRAFHEFIREPKPGVYNMGGGLDRSCSILEAIDIIDETINYRIPTKHEEARLGDHMCYYSDNSKFQEAYPKWEISKSLDDIFTDLLH